MNVNMTDSKCGGTERQRSIGYPVRPAAIRAAESQILLHLFSSHCNHPFYFSGIGVPLAAQVANLCSSGELRCIPTSSPNP